MSDNVYKLIEITGTSKKSVEEAIDNALKRAAKTVRNMRWFTVEEIRGAIDGDQVGAYQITMKVGFTLED
jgi:flavin-binding protein dodecin